LCGATYRIKRASSWEPGPSLRALERINPLKQIPTLQLPDGSVLTESAAILIHLGTAHPASKLLPRTLSKRAQEIRGLVYVAANCYAAIGVYDYPERWLPDANEADKARVRAGARRRLHWYWEVFADQYAGDAFLVDDRLSALNVLSAIVSRWCGARAHLLEARPTFHAALTRIDAHPAVAPVLARHWSAKA
ncbi:MAG: glutathione S-transferase family protein, partial [Burkholderiaceae bacterium]